MIEPLTLAVGVGLVFGLFMVEAFGLFAGGMVVPGYIALDIIDPSMVVITIITAIMINLFIRFLSTFLIIYGRRRVSLTVLLSFLLGQLMRYIFSSVVVVEYFGMGFTVIGYIIPGLIALSIDRQGLVETITTLLTVSVAVRLVLIILIGPALLL